MRTILPQAHRDIHEVLRSTWGYDAFRSKQEEVIRSVLAGKDTLALLPTGGGKSLCFQVPALATGKLCLVVSPLIALMKDQVERLRSLGISARAITSGMSYAEIDNALESAAVGKLAFLYVSPERLGTDLFLGRLPRLPLGLIAVDEAHCISQWGYDFRPAFLKIREVRERTPGIPVLALTASATTIVADDIMDKLAFVDRHLVRSDFNRPELALWISQGEDKTGRLLRIMEKVQGSAIVYLRERRGTVRTAQFLAQHGVNAAAYHAGLPTAERDRIQKDWTNGTLRCVVATNAFGMGIDKADVRSVVHMGPPPDLESYYQEAGRAGRDGKSAYAFMLLGPGDEDKLVERMKSGFPALADVRRVYQAFADMNGIAMGSGSNESYPLDMRAIADRSKLPLATVANAMKALELDGKLALSEGVHSPSRVLITTDQRSVYQVRVNDERLGPLLEALLRLHGGLFEEPAVIDESRLAKLTDRSVEKVVAQLMDLERNNVLSYRPRNDSPAATLLVPRLDAARLVLDPAALRDREKRAGDRLDAMLKFLRSTGECRARIVLTYFGETTDHDCGQCDVCRGRSTYKQGNSQDTSNVSEPLGHYHRDIEQDRSWEDEYGPSRDR